jgi:hypothetical protein
MHSSAEVVPVGRVAERISELERKLKEHDDQIEALTEIVRQLMLQRRLATKRPCGRSLRQPNMGFIETEEDRDSVFPIVTLGRPSER